MSLSCLLCKKGPNHICLVGTLGLTSVTHAEPQHSVEVRGPPRLFLLCLCRPEPSPGPHHRVSKRKWGALGKQDLRPLSEGPDPHPHWTRRGLGLRRLAPQLRWCGLAVLPRRGGWGAPLPGLSREPREHWPQGQGPGDGDPAHREGHSTRVAEKLWREGRGQLG